MFAATAQASSTCAADDSGTTATVSGVLAGLRMVRVLGPRTGRAIGRNGEPRGVSRRFTAWTRRLTPLGSPLPSLFPIALRASGQNSWVNVSYQPEAQARVEFPSLALRAGKSFVRQL